METLNQNVLNEFALNLKKIKYVSKLEDLKLSYNTETECPYIYLELIKIKKKYRNQGIGSAVMQEIVQFANVHNIQIQLYALDLYGSDLTRLYKFYRRHGFVLIKRNKDGNFVYRPRPRSIYNKLL